MYLCIYVSIYVSMYLCIYVSMYLCIYVSIYLYLSMCLSTYIYLCVYLPISIYVSIYVSIYIYLSIDRSIEPIQCTQTQASCKTTSRSHGSCRFTALGTLLVCIICGCCIDRIRILLHRTRQALPELPETWSVGNKDTENQVIDGETWH